MALTAFESRARGLVINTNDGSLSVTTAVLGSTFYEGFLRDADGRLVVQSG